jgi:hypothetical protein
MNRDDAKIFLRAALIALFIMVAATAFAGDPKLPAGISCADVRAKVAELGWLRAVAFALEQGASWRQIRDAKKCLR